MKISKLVLWVAVISFLYAACNHKNHDTSGTVSPLTTLTSNASGEVAEAVRLAPEIGAIKLPGGYKRVEAAQGSFGEYLRGLQIKQEDHIVNLYDGRKKANQGAHYCILDIDVGNRDLQQCADAVMRLRAEYLYQMKAYENISFNFTNGEPVPFKKYAEGYRVKVNGNNLFWKKSTGADYSYPNFRKYLDLIFAYAGSYSLAKELDKVTDVNEIQIGDVIIQGGFPGHAVLVMDIAEHTDTGEKIFLLAQSYMPAQEIHVLVNPNQVGISPWYSMGYSNRIYTPEWTFDKTDLKRWRD
ncbi:DUF4846 domain-containing protein [Fulvivirgaceae bacterium BMA12]|uniref:DUF4846 domain-containing protein n=1 Tax=Agaribacillus aureus TaxID=3051825 RepID=A0ABT8LG61_9BACT|nr:DUF4846 domain-containing protein [Fulvivirgaceae bacterium BMA12]